MIGHGFTSEQTISESSGRRRHDAWDEKDPHWDEAEIDDFGQDGDDEEFEEDEEEDDLDEEDEEEDEDDDDYDEEEEEEDEDED